MATEKFSKSEQWPLRGRADVDSVDVDPALSGTSEPAVVDPDQVRLGSLLAEIGRQARLTDSQHAVFDRLREDSRSAGFQDMSF